MPSDTNKLYLRSIEKKMYYNPEKYGYNVQLLSTPYNYTLVKNEDVNDEMRLYKFVEYYNEEIPIKVSLNELIELTKKNNKFY